MNGGDYGLIIEVEKVDVLVIVLLLCNVIIIVVLVLVVVIGFVGILFVCGIICLLDWMKEVLCEIVEICDFINCICLNSINEIGCLFLVVDEIFGFVDGVFGEFCNSIDEVLGVVKWMFNVL